MGLFACSIDASRTNQMKAPTSSEFTATHVAFMDRALHLAAQGVARTSPNPMVGAVLVRGEQIVAEGFHTYEGIRHAEVVALEAAGEAARGATLYVTLEPCSHTGRTGPCAKALIAAGIARVVAAMADPNPKVSGSGFRELRAAGIEVVTGVREAEARRLNEAFATWIVSGKPLVILKSALTLDGQMVLPSRRTSRRTSQRASGKSQWITSPESRAEVQLMRHACDALVTGIGTVLADDPLLTDRTGMPRRRKLLRLVLDSGLRLPLRSRLVQSADNDLVVFSRQQSDCAKAKALRRAGVEVVYAPGRGAMPNLNWVVGELGRREILGVLLEAGATLNSAALAAGIVDKMRMFIAPKVAGFSGAGISGGHTARVPKNFHGAETLSGVSMTQFGLDFAIEGYLHDVYRTR